jgi:hypothetical protein
MEGSHDEEGEVEEEDRGEVVRRRVSESVTVPADQVKKEGEMLLVQLHWVLELGYCYDISR